MTRWIRIELVIDDKVTDFSEYKITPKTTIQGLLKMLKKFLEETN